MTHTEVVFKVMPSIAQKRQLTPDNPPVKRFINSIRSPAAPFSPASFSPVGATPSKKYSSRTNAGNIVASFGATDNTSWQGQGQGCTVSAYKHRETKNDDIELKEISHDFKYMFQKLTMKAMVLNDMIDDMATQLEKKHSIEEVGNIAIPAQEEITVIGRIFCDSEGKLNAKSMMIEGSRDTSGGRAMVVDLADLKQYSLFPGQIVAMEGTNSTGQKFVAKKLYEGIQLPFPEVDPDSGPVNLTVFIAVGPFSTSDNLDYEPLKDLMKYLQRDRPDVCILAGPFVDIKNEVIESRKCPVMYDEVFDQQIRSLAQVTTSHNNIIYDVKKIIWSDQSWTRFCSIGCELIIVPSYRDVHHDNVYPQPPYMATDKNSHVHFLPDPCMVSVNGVVFGITSTDVLFHMGSEEISCNPPGAMDRLGRLAYHMVTQQSFYPLYPPSEDVGIDFEAFEVQALMPVTPHVLVTPSDLKQFVKDLNGCCCINPGRITRGQSGGTFARMVINTNNVKSNSSISLNIKAQVVRV
ncbi:hypothetical protein FSP39_019217 [Pinctada imbricata]|uniref:DNA polymerase alpha subunit B n=1 Tax=Pinctada imbricata TaxID=66713 RepID=A0AA88XXA8_PINIB|nr:hypothetical protein FSP39_019217 [Pinctada imbricata]